MLYNSTKVIHKQNTVPIHTDSFTLIGNNTARKKHKLQYIKWAY